ncbi:MAG: FlgO family outer membrane protein [Elusimicrobiales bacterium]|nr:FlgO family outer membrane protein [Elusimicrobiales bacterium]
MAFLPAAAAALFVCACSARPRPAAPPPPADPLEAVVSAILKKASDIPERTLAVYDITGVSGETSPEGRLVAERLTSRLAASGEVRVIERRRLEAALKELSLSASGAVDEAGLARAGFLSGAGAVVTGTLARLNSGHELNARAVNVVTGDVIAAASALLQIDMAAGGGTVRRMQEPRPAPPAAGPPPPGWKAWPGRGRFEFSGGTIRYCLEARQHDYLSAPKEGYYPGVLLEREIAGEKWEVEVSADYAMSGSGGQWLSVFVWLGEKDARPAINDGTLSLIARRNQDSGYGSDDFTMHYEPGGELAILGTAVRNVRIRRDGKMFSLYWSADGKDYAKAVSVFSPGGAAAPSQRIVLGGQAFGAAASCAHYGQIKLNGRPLF